MSTSSLDRQRPSSSPQQPKEIALTSIAKTCNLKEEEPYFIIDSGATCNMVADRALFKTYSSIPAREILGLDTRVGGHGIGRGSISVTVQNSLNKRTVVHISDVLHVPEVGYNLLSVSYLARRGAKVHFGSNATISFNNEELPLSLDSNVYKLFYNPKPHLGLMARTSKPSLWHERLGHPGKEIAKRIGNTTCGLSEAELQSLENDHCETCMVSKSKSPPFSKSKWTHEKPPTEFLDLVATDFTGPFRVTGAKGKLHIQVFKDWASGFRVVYPVKSRSLALRNLEKFIQEVGVPKVLRSDNAKEFKSHTWKDQCRKNRIIRQLTIMYSSQQNGLAEREIGILHTTARTLMNQRKVPTKLWPYAYKMAARILNRRPDTVRKVTPYELANKERPDLTDFRVFGCLCIYHREPVHRPLGKLDQPGAYGIFLGYPKRSKGYTIFSCSMQRIIKTRALQFLEDRCGSEKLCSSVGGDHQYEPPEFDVRAEHEIEPKASEATPADTAECPSDSASPINAGTSSESQDSVDQEHVSPDQPHQNDDTSSESQDSVDQERASPDQPHHKMYNGIRIRVQHPVGESEATHVAQEAEVEPKSYAQALTSPQREEWIRAMVTELRSLKERGTFIPTKIQSGRSLVDTKWVFKIKRDSKGKIERFKARIVARGFTQIPGLDFCETYAPVTRLSTIRLLAAKATLAKKRLKHLDVKSAYLNASLKTRILCKPPPGYEHIHNQCNEGDQAIPQAPKCWELIKSLYGLKQAAFDWNELITQYLESIGMTPSLSDPCLFRGDRTWADTFLIALYVDDLIILAYNENDWRRFVSIFKERFQLQSNEVMSWYLNIAINQIEDDSKFRITLSQGAYIESKLEAFKMKNANTVATPATLSRLTKGLDDTNLDIPYQSAVGALLYARRCTRPEISFALHQASKYNNCYNLSHWTALKRIFRYLKGTANYGVTYSSEGNIELMGYSDSDWGQDPDSRRSVTGYVFILAGAAVSWSSKAQPSVALSTFEAETQALTEAIKEAIYLRRLLRFIGLVQRQATPIYVDNQAAVGCALHGNPNHRKVKHMDLRYKFNHEAVEAKEVVVHHVPTENNLADLFTKPLPRDRFENLRRGVGLESCN